MRSITVLYHTGKITYVFHKIFCCIINNITRNFFAEPFNLVCFLYIVGRLTKRNPYLFIYFCLIHHYTENVLIIYFFGKGLYIHVYTNIYVQILMTPPSKFSSYSILKMCINYENEERLVPWTREEPLLIKNYGSRRC